MTLKSGLMLLSASVLATACATGGGGGTEKSDKVAAEKSKAYVGGMSFVMAGQSGGVCAGPTAAQKVAMSSVDGPSKDWKDLLSKASACTGDKNWKTLEQVAETMARTDINAPWGAYFMSVAAEASGDFHRALWMAELAEKKAGVPNALFLYQHGRIMLDLKETSKAMGDLQKAVALEPKLVGGHLFLAQIYHRDLEWNKAGDHYAAVLAADDSNTVALAGLGDVRANQGKTAEAADLLAKAIVHQPNNVAWWLRLGAIYENTKQNEQALNTYKALRTSIDKGEVKQRPTIDLPAKIKSLEEALNSSRQPAQASAVKVDQTRSKK